jgi:hypothetical protein
MQGACNACSFWEGHMDDEASFSHITFAAYQDTNCYAVVTIEETLLLCNVYE